MTTIPHDVEHSIASARRRRRAHAAAPGTAPISRALVLAIFVGWTLFSVFVYSRYSQLGDAQAYLTGGYDEGSQGRTLLLVRIAGALRSVLGSDLLVHLAFSLFAASGVCYLLQQADVRGRHRWPVLLLLLNPNFGVWASVTGRESLFIGLLGYFMAAVLGQARRGGAGHVLMAVLCLAGMIYIRAPFGIGIGLFYLIHLLYAWGPRLRISVGVQALFFLMVAALAAWFAWPWIDAYIGNEVLPVARSYFTIHSDTTRTWVQLNSSGDLFSGLWWTLPLSLIGPTPGEVFARPLMLPFFVAGLAVFCLFLHAIHLALFKAPQGAARGVLLLGWLPATLVILVSYVPFGIYNPGSGIRYASCFLLFLIFPSLLLATASSARSAANPSAAVPDADRTGGVRTMHSR